MKPITEVQHKHINGRRVVASVSTGKDSTALSVWLTRQGVEHDRFFIDTGWEHEDTYKYLGELEGYLGPIARIKGQHTMESLILSRGMFPTGKIRFCTQELKFAPVLAYFEERLDQGEDCINAVGVRAQESEDRALLSEWEHSFDAAETWRPLLDWTEQEVIDLIRDANIPPNPLYLRGANRVGCYPCIRADKAAIRRAYESRISEIEKLEQTVTEAAQLRATAKGKGTIRLRTFFKAGPIREVFEWSKTSRGGVQYLMLETEERGCMKWGLCE